MALTEKLSWEEESMKSYKCPNVRGEPEGSQWCELAESSVTRLGNEVFKLKERLERADVVIGELGKASNECEIENEKLKEENGKLKNEISNISTLVFGEYDLGISHYQRGKFWLSNKIGEGMELDKEMIDEMLGDFFLKNF